MDKQVYTKIFIKIIISMLMTDNGVNEELWNIVYPELKSLSKDGSNEAKLIIECIREQDNRYYLPSDFLSPARNSQNTQ